MQKKIIHENAVTHWNIQFLLQQKRLENEAALLLLPDHLTELSGLPWRERQETAATNLLAGNVFDWGAKEAAALMQVPGFGFQQALDHLQSRAHFLIFFHYYFLI